MIALPTKANFLAAGFSLKETFAMTLFIRKNALTATGAFNWLENMEDLRKDSRFGLVMDAVITPIIVSI